MSKPTFAFVSFAFIVLSSATPALATNTYNISTGSTSVKEESRVVIKENREIRKATITLTGTPKVELREKNKETRKSFLSEARLRVITKIYQNAKNSLVKRFNYLVETRKKIESKLAEKSKNGHDVSAATAKLAGTTALETNYKNHLAALETKFQEIIKSEKPMTLVPQLRAAEKLVRDDLKAIRQLQIEALKLVIKK